MKSKIHQEQRKLASKLGISTLIAGSLVLSAGLINLSVPNSAFASDKMADVYLGATNLTFEPYGDFEKAYLRIAGPKGYRLNKVVESKDVITADLLLPDEFGPVDGEPGWTAPKSAVMDLAKGRYRYEVVYTKADGSRKTQNGSFFVNDGVAYESPQAAGLPIPSPNEGLPGAGVQKTAGDKASLKFDADDLIQILDNSGDDETRLFWGNATFANWRLDNRSGDLTAERFDGGGEIRMVLQPDGDLALGTTATSDNLHVVSTDTTPSMRLEDPSGEENWQIVSGGSSTLQFDYEGSLGTENDALTIAHTGNVGVGAGLNPDKQLHVQGASADTLGANDTMLRVENTSGTEGARRMIELVNNGSPLLVYKDTARGTIWNMSPVGNSFAISLTGTGAQEFQMDGGGNLTIQGALTQNSKRSSKEGFGAVDSDTVLAKLDQLAIEEWSYKHTPESRHMSPMAEDFYATFGLGPKNGIAPTDLAGVALAAAKALKAENESLKAKVARMDQMESRLEMLEKRLAELAR